MEMIVISKSDLQALLRSEIETLKKELQPQPAPELLSKAEACRRLKIGYKRMNTLIRSGHITPTSTGKINSQDLNALFTV
jgi:hypothetical protein